MIKMPSNYDGYYMHFPIVSAVITIIQENDSNHSLPLMTASLVGLSWGMEPDNERDEMED